MCRHADANSQSRESRDRTGLRERRPDDRCERLTAISAKLLEHAEDWRAVVRNLKGVLKVGGLLVLTCRGPGFPRHDFPGDYWRFTVDDMRKIFADSQIIALIADPEPGVLLAARKTDQSETDISTMNVAALG
jgi:hypothetical protein